jgi:hypothetical protein
VVQLRVELVLLSRVVLVQLLVEQVRVQLQV